MKITNLSISKKIFAIIIVMSVCFSSLGIQRAHAILGVGDVVYDPLNTFQSTISAAFNTITGGSAPVTATSATVGATAGVASLTWEATKSLLDFAAYSAGQKLLNQLTANTIKWIQGGYHGSPSFKVDYNEIGKQVADEVAGSLVHKIKNIAVCDFSIDYKDDLVKAVTLAPKVYDYKYDDATKCPFTNTAVGQVLYGNKIIRDTKIIGLIPKDQGGGTGGLGTYIVDRTYDAGVVPDDSEFFVGTNPVRGSISGDILNITWMLREKITVNASDFYGDVGTGASVFTWALYSKALLPGGNPYSVAVVTAEEKTKREEVAAAKQDKKLSWSNGFTDIIDTSSCHFPTGFWYSVNDENPMSPNYMMGSAYQQTLSATELDELFLTQEQANQLNQEIIANQPLFSQQQKEYCDTTTPGKVVSDQLTKSLGVDMDRLGFADNMNKIIAAFLDSLTQKTIRGVFGTGNSSTSSNPSTGGTGTTPTPGGTPGSGTTPGATTPGGSTSGSTTIVATVVTGEALTIGSTSAEIHGTVQYMGYDPNISVSFGYGTSLDVDGNIVNETITSTPFHGTAYSVSIATDFSIPLTGLSPNTTYYYRARVQTSSYPISSVFSPIPTTGNTLSFTTLP